MDHQHGGAGRKTGRRNPNIGCSIRAAGWRGFCVAVRSEEPHSRLDVLPVVWWEPEDEFVAAPPAGREQGLRHRFGATAILGVGRWAAEQDRSRRGSCLRSPTTICETQESADSIGTLTCLLHLRCSPTPRRCCDVSWRHEVVLDGRPCAPPRGYRPHGSGHPAVDQPNRSRSEVKARRSPWPRRCWPTKATRSS